MFAPILCVYRTFSRVRLARVLRVCLVCESAHVYPRVFEKKFEVKLNGAISDVQFKPSLLFDAAHPVVAYRAHSAVGAIRILLDIYP